MKFIVGYPLKSSPQLVDDIINNSSHIKEVYFSFPDMPSGRSSVSADEPLHLTLMRFFSDIKRFSDAGIGLNLLFNGNCYGAESQSRALFNKIGEITDMLVDEYCVSSVTTSSPLIAKFIKQNFPSIDTRASVNMEIGTPEGLDYLSEYFDSLYVKRELNRDMPRLLRMKEYCELQGKKIYLLANSGCLNYCSARTFHDNLVSHEAEISKLDNGYDFKGACRDYLSSIEKRASWLAKTNFIRPEDLHRYEGVTSAVKLATRVSQNPTRILRAYISATYGGSAHDLLEPSHTDLFLPDYVDNSKIGAEFMDKCLYCNKDCLNCGFCADIQRRATVNLNEKYNVNMIESK